MSAAVFLTASWRNLVMLNYEVDPSVLELRTPRGTELDSFDGKMFVSVVGFQFLDARVLGIPIPFHRNFEEINLRFYVRRRAEDGLRRGVVFVKELVPRRAIALVARVVYNENYVALPMRHFIRNPVDGLGGSIVYGWRSGRDWSSMSAEFEGAPLIPARGSEEEFITEHYWGYARQSDGGTVEYQVEHPQWGVRSAERSVLDCDVESLYGSEFVEALSGPPSSAFVAEGSEVTVRRGVEI